ncbi:serine hydroxymethyltransferase [Candidatus Microgenomates bacterium]|nr:serine hydroxymethyltransferase [Candidatus Microgenomates bacterium]
MIDDSSLRSADPKLADLLKAETQRQRQGLELIPSENYVSGAVLEALGSVFTNKYAEGYPGRRYYGGQVYTDQIEQVAIDRAKQLFGADHVNVQPLSGAPANLAVYFAWCDPGDTILAMDLSHGGHLTHGAPVTVAAKLFNFVHYGMKSVETGEIDFDQVRTLAKKHRPKILLVGYSSYPRELDYQQFANIAAEVGAVAMADIAHPAGLIAAGLLQNPLRHGFQVVTSTTHKTLRGPRGGLILTMGEVSNPLKAPPKMVANLPTLIDRIVFPGFQGGPHMNVILAKALAFGEALRPEFKTYARQVIKNAKRLATELMKRGFKLVTNGTDNHLMVIDVQSSFGISGGQAEAVLDRIGLTANKNVIPNDDRPAFDPSGLRLGTPAITTRGMAESDMTQIADWIELAIRKQEDSRLLRKLSREVAEFSLKYPLPSDSRNRVYNQ